MAKAGTEEAGTGDDSSPGGGGGAAPPQADAHHAAKTAKTRMAGVHALPATLSRRGYLTEP